MPFGETFPVLTDLGSVGGAVLKYVDDVKDINAEISSDSALIEDAARRGAKVDVPSKMVALSTGLMSAALNRLDLDEKNRRSCLIAAGTVHGTIFLIDESVERGIEITDPESYINRFSQVLGGSAEITAKLRTLGDPDNPSRTMVARYAEAMAAEERFKKRDLTRDGEFVNPSLWQEYFEVSVESNSMPLMLASVAVALGEETEISKHWEVIKDINRIGRIFTDLKRGDLEKDLKRDGGNLQIAHRRWSGESESLEDSRIALMEIATTLHANIESYFNKYSGERSQTFFFLREYYNLAFNLLNTMVSTRSVSSEDEFRYGIRYGQI